MPAKGVSRQCDRDCLVCGEPTRIAHLRIECCRACAVFYRRAVKGHEFICRSSTGKCATGKGLNCKSCRFERIKTLLDKSADLNNDDVEETLSEASSNQPNAYACLERAMTHYKAMSFTRLSNELLSRSQPPHPLEISLEKGPFFPGDFASLVNAMRGLLTSSLEFGRNTFPEFGSLADSDKWTLALNFFYRFRVFEGCYRANKFFPDDPTIYFISYAMYVTVPFNESFLKTAPSGADIAGAAKYMREGDMIPVMRAARELIARVNPSEEEMIVVAVFMFWTIGDLSVSEEITELGERYRGEILKELHAYYREKMVVDDYASRLGELMMLMNMFERTKDQMKEHFEVMRMFNVMTDENFIYRLRKD